MTVLFRFFLFWLVIAILSGAAAQQNTTLFMAPPSVNPALRSALLVVVPGGLVPNQHYMPVVAAVQNATASGVNLYGVIVHCTLNLCVPAFQEGHIDAAISAAEATFALTFAPADVVIAGHSLGGVVARQYADAKFDGGVTLGGLALFGVMFTQNSTGYPDNLAAYPLPLLALAGELDFTPLSHTALNFAQSDALAAPARYAKPTVLLPRVDHSDFCPGFHVSGDIVSESSHAVIFIANVTALWLEVVFGVATPSTSFFLEQWMTQTRAMSKPFLLAHALDQKLACEHAQRYLGDIQQVGAAALVVANTTVVTSDIGLTFAHPDYVLASPSQLVVSPVSYARYDDDIQQVWAGAVDIACKAVSAQRVLAELHGGNPAPVTSLTCQSLNAAAFSNATLLLMQYWPPAIGRFKQQAKSIGFPADASVTAGPLWVLEPLGFTNNATHIDIQGISLLTDISSWIYPGVQYCKILSVSRAVEIVQTVALKNRYP